jgi:hypothetical protein
MRTAIILLVIAAVILISGMARLNDFITLKKNCTQTAVGTVVDVQYVRVGGGRYRRLRYVAEVAYTDGASEYTCLSGAKRRRFNIGSELTVRYNPQNPAESYVDEAKPNMGVSQILTAIFVAAVSAATLIRLRKGTSDNWQEEQTDSAMFDFSKK